MVSLLHRATIKQPHSLRSHSLPHISDLLVWFWLCWV